MKEGDASLGYQVRTQWRREGWRRACQENHLSREVWRDWWGGWVRECRERTRNLFGDAEAGDQEEEAQRSHSSGLGKRKRNIFYTAGGRAIVVGSYVLVVSILLFCCYKFNEELIAFICSSVKRPGAGNEFEIEKFVPSTTLSIPSKQPSSASSSLLSRINMFVSQGRRRLFL